VAFCRRGGDWRVRDKVTKKRCDVKWHRQLHDLYKEKVAMGFDSFDDVTRGQEVNVNERINDMFSKLESDLEGKCRSQYCISK
jgi:hypothetical protein